MNLQYDPSLAGDEILSGDEAEAPIAAWTLDELDDSADLGSFRSALAGADDQYA